MNKTTKKKLEKAAQTHSMAQEVIAEALAEMSAFGRTVTITRRDEENANAIIARLVRHEPSLFICTEAEMKN